MTLNLPLIYFVWTEEYCQTSPNKSKSPNLWHVTSILVCCIFGTATLKSIYPILLQAFKTEDNISQRQVSFVSLIDMTMQLHLGFVHNLNYWMKKSLDYWNRLSFDIRIPTFVIFIFTSMPPMKQYLKINWIKSFWKVSRLFKKCCQS